MKLSFCAGILNERSGDIDLTIIGLGNRLSKSLEATRCNLMRLSKDASIYIVIHIQDGRRV